MHLPECTLAGHGRQICVNHLSHQIIEVPAPGSEDTESGVLMELEVVMERRQFIREFKLEAVRLIKD